MTFLKLTAGRKKNSKFSQKNLKLKNAQQIKGNHNTEVCSGT